jgi:CRP-like cAMP-binding protein
MEKISQLYPGQFFGEMSLLTGESRSADVVATTDLVVYQLQPEHLSKAFNDHPDMIERISEILVERKYQNAQKLRDLKESVSAISPENPGLFVKKIRDFFKGVKSSENPLKN